MLAIVNLDDNFCVFINSIYIPSKLSGVPIVSKHTLHNKSIKTQKLSSRLTIANISYKNTKSKNTQDMLKHK